MSQGQKDPGLIPDLVKTLGPERVLSDPAATRRHLFTREVVLYSPILKAAFRERAVEAVVLPRTGEDLQAAVAVAARHHTPLTVRGAGLTTYGQSLPVAGGILVDTRGLNRIRSVTPDRITAESGVLFGDLKRAARARGLELRCLPSNYPVATLGGFVGGGSAGIGSSRYGFLWDGNVTAAGLFTAHDPPRRLELEGEAVLPIIHTYGTVGVMETISLPLAPARTWQEAYVTFPSFERAVRFAWEEVPDSGVAVRSLAVEQAPLPSFFVPLGGLFRERESLVLLMAEAEGITRLKARAQAAGGRFGLWPREPAMSQFSFNHSVLWAKKALPDASWLQLAFDPGQFLNQLRAVGARWGGTLYLHLDFVYRPDGSARPYLPYGRGVVAKGDVTGVDPILAFLREAGLYVINPHSYVLEEIGLAGMFLDLGAVQRLKAATDPQGILNPGKLGGHFYGPAPAAERG